CVGATSTRILLRWRITRCPLVSNKEECTRAICCSFCISQVYQHSSTIRHNANVIRFDIAMNKGWMLAMHEHNSITNRKNPTHDPRNRDDVIALPRHTNEIGQVVALNIVENNIVATSLDECILECREVGVM